MDRDKKYALEHNNLHPALINYAEHTRLHPNGVGKSLYFNRNAHLKSEDKDTGEKIYLPSSLSVVNQSQLRPENGLGIRLDMRPGLLKDEDSDDTFIQKGGMLVDIAGGTQTLKLNDAFELEFSVHNNTGKHLVKSAPLSHDAWYKVAARYYQGKLTLQVNDTTYEQSTDGSDLNYSVTTKGVVIGENFTGHLSRVKIYDWRSQPLVAFADGSYSKTLTYIQDDTQSVTLVSSGQLHQQAGSQISLVRVGFNQNQYQGFVGVMSLAHYEAVGTQMIATRIFENAPEYAYFDNQYNSNPYVPQIPFISQAHANWVVDWVVDNAYDIVVGAIGFLIPYEETISMFKQVYYLATGDEQFDSMQLTLDTLGVLTVFPAAKVFSPVIKSLRGFMKTAKGINPKFVKSLAGVIGKIGKKLMKGDLDTLLNILPMVIIVGDMLSNEESRQALNILIKSVQSDEDIFVWAEYLGLPTDGWEGDEPPPVVLNRQLEKVDNFYAFPFVQVAYASKGKSNKGKLVNTSKLTKSLRLAAKQLSKNGLVEVDGKKLVSSIKGVTEGIKKTDWPSVRKIAHSPVTLTGVLSAGRQGAQKILSRSRNLRMSPLSIMAILTYLETRNVDTCSNQDPICKPLELRVREELPKLYARAFTPSLVQDDKEYVSAYRESGYLFQIAMLAARHLQYEISGLPEDRVVAIEAPRPIKLFKYNRRAIPLGETFTRKVDIVLAGKNTSVVDTNNVWLELKSYKYQSNKTTFESYWKQWNINKSTYSNHREFFFDRVGTTDNELKGVEEEGVAVATNFEWYFQDFKRRAIRGYSSKELDSVAEWVRKLPKSKEGIQHASLGYKDGKENRTKFTQKDARKKLKPHNVKTWLLGTAKGVLLANVNDDLIDELIDKSDQF
ncbi:LamG domain-containing protein [Saccharobesus litoralis]|uniref:hypothetical protein n=1 Tax=Saccharobesus litoralis TaxID=2172099 RepID=UPI00131F331E|nr:hypothetical protein [Saccharobesus litoralis]